MKKTKHLHHHTYKQAKKIQPIGEEIMKIILIKYQNIRIQSQNKMTLKSLFQIKKSKLKDLQKRTSEIHNCRLSIMIIKKN